MTNSLGTWNGYRKTAEEMILEIIGYCKFMKKAKLIVKKKRIQENGIWKI
jgi:hypothetical protein